MANNQDIQEVIVEEKKNRKLLFMIIGIAIAIIAITAAVIYLYSKNENGERRGKVLVEKIKNKLSSKKNAELEEICDDDIFVADAE